MTAPDAPIGDDLSPEERKRIEDEWNGHEAIRYLGARVDLSDPAAIRLLVDPVQPHHRGGLGTNAVNGVAMAVAQTPEQVVGVLRYVLEGKL